MLRKFQVVVALSWALSSRTLRAKYRKSFLGYFWLIAPAMVVSGGASIAHSAGLLRPGETELSYPLFVFIGTVLWQSFADTATLAHRAIEGARSYITRVQFSREALILGQVYEALFVFGVRLVVVLTLLCIFASLSWYGAFIVVLCNFLALVLGIGFSMIVMPFTILFSDLDRTLKLALNYGLFLTPAMYEPAKGSLLAAVISLNPISSLIEAVRDASTGLPLSSPGSLYAIVGLAFILLVAGMSLVRVSTPIVVERMLVGGR